MTPRTSHRIALLGVLALLLAACAAPPPPRTASEASAQAPREGGPRKVLNLALLTIINGFSIAAGSTTSGGGLSYIEIHSQALFTADKTNGRPVPRLLAEMPTLDNGGLRLTDDGKMLATYRLRPD